MELFVKNMNFSYKAVHNLLNEMYIDQEGRSWEEIEAVLKEYQMEPEWIEPLADEENRYRVFKEEDGVYVPRWDSFFTAKDTVPVYADRIARKALREMAADEMVGMMMSPGMKEIIEENCDDPLDVVKEKSKSPIRNRKEDMKYFSEILEAILEKHMIKYTYEAREEKFEDKLATPVRFLFSNRKNQLQLIAIPEGEERLILMNLSSFRKVEKTKRRGEGGAEEFLESRKTCVILEMEEHRNVIERSFSIFTHLKKEARYDKEKKIYILKVWYYDFDESDMIQDILSLGPAVMVVEPPRIRKAIYQEACGCVENYCGME